MFIDDVCTEYPDTSHNCYAFIVGDTNGSADIGMRDDGEVPGTAAKPMINVLKHRNIGEIVSVVTRYFGKIKLGWRWRISKGLHRFSSVGSGLDYIHPTQDKEL